MTELEQANASFATTQWTLLQQLKEGDEGVRRAAAERIAQAYWPPVYASALRLTHSPDAAVDLTQGFFADVVFGRNLLERADKDHGTLRSLIRSALRRYATDQWRREMARGRGRVVSLRDLQVEAERRVEGDADTAFDRRWAMALFDEALHRCAKHFVDHGRAAHWKLFEARLVRPALQGIPPPELIGLAAEFGFETGNAATAAVQTVKRRFEMIFRAVVAETVSRPDQIEEEWRAVREAIAGA
ncbi:MAG: hypothetical protein KJZ65_02340 [Phycisphaerales bacterium]|nr:hypothetical protein [Phycisphaerales bacterium]